MIADVWWTKDFQEHYDIQRKPCATLFLEAEYDALILEAYLESRVTTQRLKNGRYPFSCIFCKEIHKDKNMTSYHRMFNLCKVYKEPAVLKMYPTWEKSDHAELNKIAKKYGKFSRSASLQSPLLARNGRLRTSFIPPVKNVAILPRLMHANHELRIRARYHGLG